MKTVLMVTVMMLSGAFAQAKNVSNSNECVDYLNSVFNGTSEDARLTKALSALNLAYDLKLTESQFIQVETLAAQKKISQDGLEKMTYFGCTEDITTADQKIAQDQFAAILR